MEPGKIGSILLDSTVLIDISRGDEKVIYFIDTARKNNQSVAISIISSMELIIGCRDKNEVNKTLKFLKDYSIIDISIPISRGAFRLVIQYNKSHGLIIPDAFIAATALVENLILVTSNVRHFNMIENLSIQEPFN